MSALEQALADYLRLRHSLGHEMAEAARLLPGLVANLDARGLPSVTIEAALAWAQQAPKSPAGRVTTIGPRRDAAEPSSGTGAPHPRRPPASPRRRRSEGSSPPR